MVTTPKGRYFPEVSFLLMLYGQWKLIGGALPKDPGGEGSTTLAHWYPNTRQHKRGRWANHAPLQNASMLMGRLLLPTCHWAKK
jgi:hypothetical protein